MVLTLILNLGNSKTGLLYPKPIRPQHPLIIQCSTEINYHTNALSVPSHNADIGKGCHRANTTVGIPCSPGNETRIQTMTCFVRYSIADLNPLDADSKSIPGSVEPIKKGNE